MTQDKRVGIFMRVYRNEPDMHRAVKSVKDQTYKNWKYYILVNDKTKDEMSRYAKDDDRIVIMDGKPVDGFSMHAKEIAQDGNDYLTTIDADDCYTENYLETLVGFAEQFHTDVTAVSYEFVDEKGKSLGKRELLKDAVLEVSQMNQGLKYTYGFFRSIWGKLFTSEVIRNYNQERLPASSEYGGYGGDTIFTFNALYEAERVGISKEIGYKYTVSSTSGSHKLLEGRLYSDELLFNFVKKFMETKSVYDEFVAKMLFAVYGNALNDTINLILEVDLPEDERMKALNYVLNRELTRLLLVRNEMKTLQEIDNTDFFSLILRSLFMNKRCEINDGNKEEYYRVYRAVCYTKDRVLEKEEFFLIYPSNRVICDFHAEGRKQLCKALIEALPKQEKPIQNILLHIIRKANELPILSPVLEDSEFVCMYSELISIVYGGEPAAFFEKIGDYFGPEDIPGKTEELLLLWNNYAALTETVDQYVLSREMYVEYLINSGNKEAAKLELKELKEMGVEDVNTAYLEGLL